MHPTTRFALPRRLFAGSTLALAMLVSGGGAGYAQSSGSIPGLIIANPQRTMVPPPSRQKADTKSEEPAKRKPTPRQRQASAEEDKKSTSHGGKSLGIAVLVNDEPVTAYEIEQRAAFLAVSSGGAVTERARENLKQIAQRESTNQRLRAILEETVRANPGKSRDQVLAAFEERKKDFVQTLQRQALQSARASLIPTFKKQATEELIEERLKLQEAKRLNINVDDAEANKIFKGVAERNKMTEQQFAEHLKGQGIDPASMKARLRAQSAWRDVIRRRFGHMVSITARDVDKLVGASAGDEQTELQLHKITLTAPGKFDQKAMARRLEEAEALRRRFGGCKSTAALAKKTEDATFEDLGFKKAETVSEPTRSLLLNAKDGEMVPASLAPSGVELYAVCARRTVKADEQKRQQAENELTQKEFDVLARRHLRDLRQDAMIEYR